VDSGLKQFSCRQLQRRRGSYCDRAQARHCTVPAPLDRIHSAGLVLVMERGQVGHRYILGSESIPLKSSRACGGDQRPPSSAHSGSRSGRGNGHCDLGVHRRSRDAPSSLRHGRGCTITLRATALSIEKAQRELGYAPRPVEPALRETIAYLLGAR
jgi:dihydroflavonol-4-reductase